MKIGKLNIYIGLHAFKKRCLSVIMNEPDKKFYNIFGIGLMIWKD